MSALAFGVAPAIAVVLASRTHALTSRPASVAAARHDGRLLAGAIVVLVLAAALLPAGLDRLRGKVALGPASRRALVLALALVCAAVVAAGLVRVGGPRAAVHRAYQAFNAPTPLVKTNASQRLFSLSGSNRTEYWRVAWREYEDHPWLGGNKRTATILVDRFLHLNGIELRTTVNETVEMALAVEPRSLPAPPCRRAIAAPATVDSAKALEGFDASVVHAMRELQAPGVAVGAIVDGRVILAKGYGVRELGQSATVTPDTIFAVGSMTKSFTAVTVAALVCGVALLLAARGEEAPPPGRALRGLGLVLAALLGVVALAGYVGNQAAASASDALDAEQLSTAATDAKRARRWEPWSSEPWRLLGEAQLQAGRVEQARTSFLRGIRRDRGDWELWLDLALASRGTERRDALSSVATLNPLSTELRGLRGSP